MVRKRDLVMEDIRAFPGNSRFFDLHFQTTTVEFVGPSAGVVRTFRYDEATDRWNQIAEPKILEGTRQKAFFGTSVTLSDDGLTLAVGSADAMTGAKGAMPSFDVLLATITISEAGN